MKINTISYHKVFNLGNYSNEKIGIDIALSEDDNPLDVFAEAKKQVEKSHQFFQDLPKYQQAKKMKDNPDDFTGRDIKVADEIITAFESNYPDFINTFFPASRQLNESQVDDIPW